MKSLPFHFLPLIGAGAAAGLAGTGVMIAMRLFDKQYAPKTVPKRTQDAGGFQASAAERDIGIAGAVTRLVEKSAALATDAGNGAVFGILYGLWQGKGKPRSALGDGIALGALAYAAGSLGWMPALNLNKPVWKQEFPEVAGELLRQVAYGVATTAVYGMIEAM